MPANPYDDIPYDNHPFPQTHPSRLATVATLFGLTPTPIEKCRVLDLGCAAGGNIVPIAELYPHSEFVGVDYSARQIADGLRLIERAGLKNVQLHQMDIMEADASLGTFDYIICHGVFSWVPDAVRQKILSICASNLTPTGVAYVSYNTYPGWHTRGMIRHLLRYHTGQLESPRQKLAEARGLIDFLTQATNQEADSGSALLRQELTGLRPSSDSYLYHEYLVGVNDPFCFHQFIEMIHKHGLRYLGEARMSTMGLTSCSPEVQKSIAAVATDQIQTEQYLDFVRNRPFRETLLVHPTARPNWSIRPEVLHKLHITLHKPLNDEGVDPRSNTTSVKYTTAIGMTLTTTTPVVKAAVRVLNQKWPATVSFAELDQCVQALLGTKSDGGQQLAVALLNAYFMSGLTEFHSAPIQRVTAKERPVALRVARANIEGGRSEAATRRHEFLQTTELDNQIIMLLDGTRDRESILAKLVQLSISGDLQVHNKEGQRLLDPLALRMAFGRALEKALDRYMNTCLLKE